MWKVKSRMNTFHLSDEQCRFYHEHGYLHCGRVLDDDAVTELRQISEDLLKAHKEDVELAVDAGETYPLFTQVFIKYPRYGELIHQHPALLDIIESILGPTFRLVEDQLFYKPAHQGGSLLPHTDNIYYGFSNPRIVTCWLALDDAVPENGCLQMFPGSHREDIQHEAVDASIIKKAVIDESRALAVPAATGEMIIFDGLTVHGSGPNRTDGPRRVANMVAIVPCEDSVQSKFDDRMTPYLRGGPAT